ncbi:DUF6644 family protein [Amaricoccus sp.]|uniref:DUF6644 family protein n=1 Tax=Amaricoccus sp. TaxID=1872485 RepID=UPI001B489D4B|nr:DUF6644 family protein [Amaricoccus sp.]MBP7240546.1 hypothetical protein [Amaricoccus sp.]
MEHLLAAIEGSAFAESLRWSRWTYPFVNALHVVGLAALFGSILPLDLRMLGLFRSVPLAGLTQTLRPVAASGLALAVASGLALFSVRATEYAAMPLFRAKLALVAFGAANALLLTGPRIHAVRPGLLRLAGAASLLTWLAVIVAGRWLGYLD